MRRRSVIHLPPRRLAELMRRLQCDACGAQLIRAEHYWVCPEAFHSKAVPDSELLERLRIARDALKVVESEDTLLKMYLRHRSLLQPQSEPTAGTIVTATSAEEADVD